MLLPALFLALAGSSLAPLAQGAPVAEDLLLFAKAFSYQPASPGWTSSTDLPTCQWRGVACEPETQNGSQLFAVDLSAQSLGGTLPASWASLPSLTAGLTSLNLSRNMLQGMLPTGWGAAGSFDLLAELDLTGNQLRGTVPAIWTGFQGLGSLRTLLLSDNGLWGRLPPAWTVRPPRWVTQGRLEVKQGNDDLCAPNGALPSTFKTVYDSDSGDAASLQDCGSSELGLDLLRWSQSFSNFAQVAANNSWHGWTMDEVDTPCSWSEVTCAMAPGWLYSIGGPWVETPLLTLVLNNLGLEGTMDSSWEALSNMFHLQLNGASLKGQLPRAQSWPKLQYLSMANSGLQTTLPAEWGSPGAFPKLHKIDMYENPGLTGSLPEQWGSHGSLAALHTLTLANNSLSGTLPLAYGTSPAVFPALQVFDVRDNTELTGDFPAWGANGGLANLHYLNVLRNPSLAGTIPPSLASLSNLESLLLEGTSICGEITTGGNSSNNVEPHTFTGPVPCPAAAVQEAAATGEATHVEAETTTEASAWSRVFQWVSSAVHFSG